VPTDGPAARWWWRTAVRATDVIDELEARLNRPVVTSNSAVAWHATRRLAITEPVKGAGRLSTMSPASP
jgi:maleate isomerase